MRLAEALLERADAQKRIEHLQSRIVANASHQEGEEPSENAEELIATCLATIDRLQELVTAINLTNATTVAEDGRTMTALLAARESLRLRHSVLVKAADAAAGGWSHRQLRSELRQVAALPVAALREQTDVVARELRELDALVQRTNWEAELQGL